MMNRRAWLGGAASFLLRGGSAGAQGASGTKLVFEHDLPDTVLKQWSATVIEVAYGPGEASRAHRHPGITLAYVLEGEVRSQVGDEPEKTYAAGQMFLETPNQLHSVSRNGSATQPARLLAILLGEKGKPRTVPAND